LAEVPHPVLAFVRGKKQHGAPVETLQRRPKRKDQKSLPPALQAWLDDVIIPIIVKEILSGD
jgi:hypothetical protein